MIEYKPVISSIAVVLALGSYIPYLRDISRGKTKPHTFSWFIWGLLHWIGFAASVVKGGGAGSWVTGASALACSTVFVIALVKGETKLHPYDWVSLSGALVALIFWWFTNEPTFSVMLVALIDILGFIPTFRKTYKNPYEETAITYFIGSIYFLLSLIALESYSISTWFYPATIIIVNTAFVAMIYVRKKRLAFRSRTVNLVAGGGFEPPTSGL